MTVSRTKVQGARHAEFVQNHSHVATGLSTMQPTPITRLPRSERPNTANVRVMRSHHAKVRRTRMMNIQNMNYPQSHTSMLSGSSIAVLHANSAANIAHSSHHVGISSAPLQDILSPLQDILSPLQDILTLISGYPQRHFGISSAPLRDILSATPGYPHSPTRRC
jgi:hypothetical protein